MMYCPYESCPNLFESGIAAEFQDGITHCSDCGHLLEPGALPSAPLADGTDSGTEATVTVAVYDSPEAAHTAKGLLEADGLEVVMTNEYASGVLSVAATALGGVGLAVAESRAEEAQALVTAYSAVGSELALDDDYVDGWRPMSGALPAAESVFVTIEVLFVLLVLATLLPDRAWEGLETIVHYLRS